MPPITGLGILTPLPSDSIPPSTILSEPSLSTTSSTSTAGSHDALPSTPGTPYSPLFPSALEPSYSFTSSNMDRAYSPTSTSPTNPFSSNSHRRFKAHLQSPTPSPSSSRTPKGRDHPRPTLIRTPPTNSEFPPTPLMTDEQSDHSGSGEDGERADGVSEMPMSPSLHQFTIAQSSSSRRPSSPLVPSPETPPFLAAPGSPLEGRTRIHSRNLSLFFPQPGSQTSPLEPGEQVVEAPITDISSHSKIKVGRPPRTSIGAEGLKGFKFGEKQPGQVLEVPVSPRVGGVGTALEGSPVLGGGGKPVGRKGHHHKHSLSHNFFSFLDPTVTSSSLAPITGSTESGSNHSHSPSHDHSHSHITPLATPKPVPTSFMLNTTSKSASSPSLPAPSSQTRPRTLLSSLTSLPPATQLAAGFGVLELFIGLSLWVDGQAGGSVAVTGLGYLVVWDAAGVGLGVWGGWVRGSEGGEGSLRRPFGSLRTETLMYFVQSIFLLFASVYIAKESVEHVLLSGHNHHEDFYELEFPFALLLWSVLAGTFAAVGLGNHQVLVEAVGPTLLAREEIAFRGKEDGWKGWWKDRWELLRGNPFSGVVVLCCGLALVGGWILPQDQLVNLDKSLALLETLTSFYISYPTTLAFARVLLQTAPPERSPQMVAFREAIEEIEHHELVTRVEEVRVWGLTPHQPGSLVPLGGESRTGTPMTSPTMGEFKDQGRYPTTPPRRPGMSSAFSSPTVPRFKGFGPQGGGDGILVATLTVFIGAEAEERDILEVTRFAYERCAGAIGLGGGGGKGREGHGQGEVSVMVKRVVQEKNGGHGHSGNGHAHGHGHGESCGHTHG